MSDHTSTAITARPDGAVIEPYYEDDFVTLFLGDCLEVLPALGPVDLILADPPYNLGIDYATHDDDQDIDAFEDWCRSWHDALPDSQRTIIFPGLARLPMWCNIRQPHAIGCWHIPGNPGRGFPWSFVEWEPFLYWGGFMGGSSVYRHPINAHGIAAEHPCPKPLGLFKALIARAKAQSVLDPFAGSGTSLIAAKSLGVRSVGVEVSEQYCELIVRRLSQEVLDFGGVA